MLLDHEPVHARVTHETTGAEYEAAAALVLMNTAEDDGRTTGWYWTRVPERPTPDELKATRRWREAVRNQHGPFADAGAALRAAARVSEIRQATARRLEQAAALVREGELDATPDDITRWIAEHPAPPTSGIERNAEPVLTDAELEHELYKTLRDTDERWFRNAGGEDGAAGAPDAA